MRCSVLLLVAIAASAAFAQGSSAGSLNVTLQLTTVDFLPVSTLLHAAAGVWGVNETSIKVLSATARHAAEESRSQAGARRLLEAQDTTGNIQLDFAAMQRDDPKLLTLKDFVMSSNQAPESPSDVLGLLQAFSEFKQGSVSDDYIESPSARFALTSMKPDAKSQKTTALSTASASLPQADSTAADIHPHLLFLKTGGGATVSQPKHHLTPQQLQTLADGTGTLEGLAFTSQESFPTHSKAAAGQQHKPLGVATVVLDAQNESTQQLASLFTPRNGQAITKALQRLSHAESQPAAQGLFSSGFDSVSDQTAIPVVKTPVRPTAKSLQGVYMDQPLAEKAGFSALKAAAANRDDPLADPMLSLSWLDEPTDGQIQGPIQGSVSEGLHDSSSLDEQKPVLRSAVLLTMVLSIATNSIEALQQVVGDSILSRQLQQEIGKQGFSVSQLDASFDKQGVFSSRSGAFSVEIAETQGEGAERVKVSVRTIVRRQSTSDGDHHDNKTMLMEAGKGAVTGTDDSLQDSWLLDLFICIAGFVAAFCALMLGIYKYSKSKAGQQACEQMASEQGSGFWICGQNPLRQPLIPKHAAAEEIC